MRADLRPWTALAFALFAPSLAAQAPAPQHLLRMALPPDATQYYRKTMTSRMGPAAKPPWTTPW